MRYSLVVFLFVIGICGICSGQSSQSDFTSPVDHQLRLTGNFMELRPNHFHAGIDIKSTNGQPGDLIRNVYDGHVSRIKVRSGSYGNALYIDHPNGYTSVYAHLDEFSSEIAAYVKEMQYAVESFEVDIYPPDSLFRLDQKTPIGTMGNTGRSFGPHLHFELRETKSEHPVNPELLGIGPEDSSAPKLESLHLHLIGEQDQVVDKTVKYFNPKAKGYKLYSDTLNVSAAKVGCGMQMYDRMDGSWNKNGIYAYRLFVDEVECFSWQADEFSFDESRLINGFWDFQRKEEHGQKVYLLYRSACNNFSFYQSAKDGIIELEKGKSRKVRIEAADLHGNKSECSFFLKNTSANQPTESEDIISCDTTQVLKAGYFNVTLEENSFFRPTAVTASYSQKKVAGMTCPTVTIGNSNIPVKQYYKVATRMPEKDIEKWTLVKQKSNGRYKQFGGDTIDGQFVSYLDELGTFSLYKDTIPPSIKPVSFSASLSSPWVVEIKDNLDADGRARGLAYRATINGEWIRMMYDAKNDRLIFDDADRLPDGPKQFELNLRDHCGNTAVYRRRIN